MSLGIVAKIVPQGGIYGQSRNNQTEGRCGISQENAFGEKLPGSVAPRTAPKREPDSNFPLPRDSPGQHLLATFVHANTKTKGEGRDQRTNTRINSGVNGIDVARERRRIPMALRSPID